MLGGVALRVDAEHRLLADVAALAVVEELRERRLEREVILVDVDAVAQEARADPHALDLRLAIVARALGSGALDDRRAPHARPGRSQTWCAGPVIGSNVTSSITA